MGSEMCIRDRDQMHLGRPVLLARLARAGDHVEVGRDVLAGGGAGQQRQQGRDVLQLFNDLLDLSLIHI